MLTTDEWFNSQTELTLEQIVTLRRPAWTISEVHFWRHRPGWRHQLTPPSEVPPDGWLHSAVCSRAVCGPRTRLTV